MFEKISKWYVQGLWTNEMVFNAAKKGVISPEDAEKIAGDSAA